MHDGDQPYARKWCECGAPPLSQAALKRPHHCHRILPHPNCPLFHDGMDVIYLSPVTGLPLPSLLHQRSATASAMFELRPLKLFVGFACCARDHSSKQSEAPISCAHWCLFHFPLSNKTFTDPDAECTTSTSEHVS